MFIRRKKVTALVKAVQCLLCDCNFFKIFKFSRIVRLLLNPRRIHECWGFLRQILDNSGNENAVELALKESEISEGVYTTNRLLSNIHGCRISKLQLLGMCVPIASVKLGSLRFFYRGANLRSGPQKSIVRFCSNNYF